VIELAGKPNGPKHQENALRRDDPDLRQRGRTGLLQAVPESAQVHFPWPKQILRVPKRTGMPWRRKTCLVQVMGFPVVSQFEVEAALRRHLAR